MASPHPRLHRFREQEVLSSFSANQSSLGSRTFSSFATLDSDDQLQISSSLMTLYGSNCLSDAVNHALYLLSGSLTQVQLNGGRWSWTLLHLQWRAQRIASGLTGQRWSTRTDESPHGPNNSRRDHEALHVRVLRRHGLGSRFNV